MGNRNQRLVESIAAGLIEREDLALQLDVEKGLQLLVNGQAPRDDFTANTQQIWEEASAAVLKRMKALRPETLGRIAVTGLAYGSGSKGTSIYSVHYREFLGKSDSGRKLLITLAATTVVAKMWDLLEKEFEAKSSGVSSDAQ